MKVTDIKIETKRDSIQGEGRNRRNSMGLFYEHVTTYGPSQFALADYMRQSGRKGYISPTIDGVTVVYDQASSMNVALIFDLARDLSAHFSCPALAVHIHDSDVLYYQFFQGGELLDTYDSQPGYFDDNVERSSPSGGDAGILCASFGKPEVTEQVKAVLRHSDDVEPNDFWSAEERHEKLSQAFGWPSFIPYIGYDYLAAGEVDDAFDSSGFIKVDA